MKKEELRKYLLESLWVMLITIPFCIISYSVIDFSTFGAVSGKKENANFLNYFYVVENQNDRRSEYIDDVVIMDISGVTSRGEIARAIEKISAMEPKRITLDVIFPPSSAMGGGEDSVLYNTVAGTPDLITSCRIVESGSGRYTVEHSFFTPQSGVRYGFANSSVAAYYDSETVGGENIPSFVALASGVAKAGKEGRTYINYRNKSFTTINIREPYTRDDIQGKTIIVGDTADRRDYHDVPFRINGRRRVPGVELCAYGVATLQRGDWITRMPDWICVIIGIVFTYIYAFFYLRMQRIRLFRSLTRRFITFVLILTLTLVTYLFFTWGDRVINLVYAMLGVATVGLAYDVYCSCIDIFKARKAKRKNKIIDEDVA